MRAEVTRLEIERWALGDLPPDEARELESRRGSDADLDLRMARVQEEIAEAAVDLPFLDLPVEEPGLVEGLSAWLRPALSGLVAVAAAAAVVVAVLPGAPTHDVYRGAMDLEIQRVRLGSAVEQGAVVRAQEGDRIQFQVRSAQPGVLAVFNVQDDGAVQTYLQPRPVAPREAVSGAVLLDDYAGAERIFFVVADQEVGEDAVHRALELGFDRPLVDLDRLPGLDGTQRSVLVLKERP